MRDNQHLMTEFVQIVQRYPEIYDQNLDTYRTRFSEIAWAKVAAEVRAEMKEECTIEELKVKWKGIRSSFSRYRAKLNPHNENSTICRKYYLYDHLRFLEPFVKGKGSPGQENEKSDTSVASSSNYIHVDVMEESDDYSIEEWNHIDIKPDVTNTLDKQEHEPEAMQATKSNNSDPSCCDKTKKRKYSFEGLQSTEDDEDLTFFKSILPDIRNFTIKEKRKLKMGILQLIDEIEKERET